MKRFTRLTLVALCMGSAAQPWANPIDVPPLASIEARIKTESFRLDDPEMGLGELYHQLSAEDIAGEKLQNDGYDRWDLQAKETMYSLLSGAVEQFNDRLARLISDVDVRQTIYAIPVARVLQVATEAGVPGIDPELFKTVDRGLNDALKKSRIDRAEYPLYTASYNFWVQRPEALRSLGQTDDVSDPDQLFIAGYANLLLAKLTKDVASVRTAVDQLSRSQAIYSEQPHLAGTSLLGRVSLQLADAQRLMAQFEKRSEERRQYVNEAVRAARVARQNIDFLDYPLLWGAAYRVTSETMDLLYQQTPDPSERQRIGLLRDRAYEISVSYR